jgi:hypothetical protein
MLKIRNSCKILVESEKRRTHLGDLGVDGSKILKIILNI